LACNIAQGMSKSCKPRGCEFLRLRAQIRWVGALHASWRRPLWLKPRLTQPSSNRASSFFCKPRSFQIMVGILSLEMGALVQQVGALQGKKFQYAPQDAGWQCDIPKESSVAGHRRAPLHEQTAKVMVLCDSVMSVRNSDTGCAKSVLTMASPVCFCAAPGRFPGIFLGTCGNASTSRIGRAGTHH